MPSLSALVDNFNDGVIGPNWGDSYGGATETGGRARVPLVAGAYAGYQTGRAWTLAGASVYLKLVTRPAASTGTDVSANFLVTSATAGTSIGFKYNAVTNKLRLQSNVDYYDPAAIELTYSATDHLWLRLREDGTNVYWDTSPNGSTWTNRRTLATPAWVTAAVDQCALDLYAYRDAGVTDYAEYDNVNTLADGAVYTASAALTGDGATTATAAFAAITGASLTAEDHLDADVRMAARAEAALDVDSELGAETAGTDTGDVDVAVSRPYASWVVSAPWR
ncbi:hypothetical protein ABZ742_04120 [Streptomyces albogriseolus]|uniref:hypothetical protein n=1 Tax=Streptomyces albogriseolus TaxID=1887 RepID=UPI003460D5D2